MSLSRVFLYSSALTFVANYAVAKYCVKLPTCEELGYIYSADKYPNNRSIKCPFDTKKILLLDYCQAYGLTSCDSTSGELACQVGGPTSICPGSYSICPDDSAWQECNSVILVHCPTGEE